MRTGYTVQSSYADKQLREVMWQYAQYGYRCDEDTIAAIAEETPITPKNVEEILMGGLLNMNMTDFYRHYGDEDSEESMEEVAVDGISQTEELYLRIEKAEKVMSTFESLNYRNGQSLRNILASAGNAMLPIITIKTILIRTVSLNANREEKYPSLSWLWNTV